MVDVSQHLYIKQSSELYDSLINFAGTTGLPGWTLVLFKKMLPLLIVIFRQRAEANICHTKATGHRIYTLANLWLFNPIGHGAAIDCRGVCKVLLWLVEYILNQSTANLSRISNSIEISFVGRAPGSLSMHLLLVSPTHHITHKYVFVFVPYKKGANCLSRLRQSLGHSRWI